MLWLIRLSGFISATLITLLLSPSLHPSSPALAIRSLDHNLHPYRSAPSFPNSPYCPSSPPSTCHPNNIHVAMTLDLHYLRGSVAAVHSLLAHSHCPDSLFFHFLVSDDQDNLQFLIRSTFPNLRFKFYSFDPDRVRRLISTSVRSALEQPLNYARNYLTDILDPCVERVIYLDSDLIVVDDVAKLWSTDLGSKTIGAPEYCHANFTKYFTNQFWSDKRLSSTFAGRRPCYFNTGVMVMDLVRWRRAGYTRRIERWMEVQKAGGRGDGRIYELGSLPPFLLVFAGNVAAIEHRWNQHGLGGDNVNGSCRNLHPGPVSLLHWSGSGKPWVRLDENRPCPLDHLWAPYDLFSMER